MYNIFFLLKITTAKNNNSPTFKTTLLPLACTGSWHYSNTFVEGTSWGTVPSFSHTSQLLSRSKPHLTLVCNVGIKVPGS